MSTDLKAIPTEYEGVRFRSKSEAIFARCLDLAGIMNWHYEPKLGGDKSDWDVPPHDWDFMVDVGYARDLAFGIARNDYQADFEDIDQVRTMFIEYKPSKPTQAYVDNLLEKCKTYFVGDRLIRQKLADSIQRTFDWRSKIELAILMCHQHGKTIGEIAQIEHWRANQDFYLVWGSPFNGPAWFDCSYVIYPITSSHGKHGRSYCSFLDGTDGDLVSHRHDIAEILGITEEMAQEARSYRFDLKH